MNGKFKSMYYPQNVHDLMCSTGIGDGRGARGRANIKDMKVLLVLHSSVNVFVGELYIVGLRIQSVCAPGGVAVISGLGTTVALHVSWLSSRS